MTGSHLGSTPFAGDHRHTSVAPSDRRPIVISGPSGVGKSTLCKKLLAAHPGTFAITVSHTTRAPRAGEAEGITYYYVSRDTFESLIKKDTFIEYTEFNGNLYGTSKQTVVDQAAKGLVVLLDIEMKGIKQLQSEQLKADSQINPRYIFIRPPNITVLEERLRGRRTEDESSIRRRLARARTELDFSQTGVYDKIIVNHDLEAAFRELEEFVFDTYSVEGSSTSPVED
ncbi:hypothetical protein ACRALDRAFT_1062050 [Sodiomyces alcalophilus JCM 7366]|uniref:uncharacterized protein n=1 Tax=Sodiomyces alcalophilus JCM 7366 TaxID=591952 RepID=UPI0039B4F9B3